MVCSFLNSRLRLGYPVRAIGSIQEFAVLISGTATILSLRLVMDFFYGYSLSSADLSRVVVNNK